MTAAMATAAKITPKDAKPFHRNDAVVYPKQGIGHVDRVGLEEIAGHQLQLIQSFFEDSQMTLRVPVAQARAARLRKLASREVLAEAIDALKVRPRISRHAWAKRSQEYLAKINTSNPGVLAKVVRDLQSPGEGPGSSFSQRNLFALAVDRLAGDFAAINRISRSDAVALINQALVEARTESTIGCEPADLTV